MKKILLVGILQVLLMGCAPSTSSYKGQKIEYPQASNKTTINIYNREPTLAKQNQNRTQNKNQTSQNSTKTNSSNSIRHPYFDIWTYKSYDQCLFGDNCIKKEQRKILNVDDMAVNIVDQLINTKLMPIKKPVGVTVIVDLNRLNSTTDFGRLLSEDIMTNLERAGMAVIDLRAQKFISINNNGEFYLSRNIKKIRDQYGLGYILVGTYSVSDYITEVNVRLIDASSGYIVATAHSSIPTAVIEPYLYNSASPTPLIELKQGS